MTIPGIRSIGALLLVAVLLTGCLIPDAFELSVTVPNANEAVWSYSGRWQFFVAGFDPRTQTLPPADVASLTSEFKKLPGSISVQHLENNIWNQTIKSQYRLEDSIGRPVGVYLPSGTVSAELWIVHVNPAAGNAVMVETPQPPSAPDQAALRQLGYRSQGTLVIETTGTIHQTSGPPLSKAWFKNAYSTKFDFLSDPPIKVHITW
jgi:hypothetical protein